MKNWLTNSFKEPSSWWMLSWAVTLPCYIAFFWAGVQKRPGPRFAALLVSAATWGIAYAAVGDWLPSQFVAGNWWWFGSIVVGWIVAHIIFTIIAAIIFCELRSTE